MLHNTKIIACILVFILFLLPIPIQAQEIQQDAVEKQQFVKERTGDNQRVASKPIYDGAADPVVIWNREDKRWFMFYTNRRANADGLEGVTWIHGTRIGIAESMDGGATWHVPGIPILSG